MATPIPHTRWLEVRNGVAFYECVLEVCRSPMVKEYDRLRGTNLSMKGAPLELMIDQATGRFENEVEDFIEWIYTDVWSRF